MAQDDDRAASAGHCEHPNDGLALISEFNFSSDETAVLTAGRYICCGMVIAHYDPISPAVASLETALPTTTSVSAFIALTHVLEAIRDTRSAAFDFVDPRCAHCSRYIAPHEVQMILLLQAVKSGDPSAVRELAASLADGGNIAPIVAAAGEFSRVIEISERITTPSQSPSQLIH